MGKTYRKRKCQDCGKPLGSSVVYCHECGGEERLEREQEEEDL